MKSPYTSPTSDPSQPDDRPAAPPWTFFLWIAVSFGGCGSILSLPAGMLWASVERCMGTQPSPLCNPVISWGIPIAASIILPTLIFAVLSPRWTATRLHHCILGTGSVFATVLVTFGIWRLIHNIPLLSNGYRFLIENFLMVAVAGLILSPVGWILGSWLPTRAAPAQASDE